MIARRRCPSPIPAVSSHHTAASSGPRCANVRVIASSVATLTGSDPRNPVMPHISGLSSNESRIQPQQLTGQLARGRIAMHLVIAHPLVYGIAGGNLRDDESAAAVKDAQPQHVILQERRDENEGARPQAHRPVAIEPISGFELGVTQYLELPM